MSEGELLLEKFNQIRSLGSAYVQIFKTSIGPKKWELIKIAKREGKKKERLEYLARLKEARAAEREAAALARDLERAAAKVERLRWLEGKRPEVEAGKQSPQRTTGRWREEPGRKEKPAKENEVVSRPAPTYTTSVTAAGQVILHMDKQTKILIKPGRDPEQVFQKYIQRNSPIEKF